MSQRHALTSKPKLGISACLLGAEVRYNGGHKESRLCSRTLSEYFDFVPLCPEVGAGMPVPREAVDLFGDARSPRMVGVVTGEDWTARANAWIDAALDRCEALGVAGFVLKARSPSCGVGTAALYAAPGAEASRTDGLLAGAIRRRFPHLPLVEDEGLDVAAFVARARGTRR